MTASRATKVEPTTDANDVCPPAEIGPVRSAALAPPKRCVYPVDHTAEAPAIAALARRGFTSSFVADDDHLRIAGTQWRFRPEDVRIRDYYRFEGTSDPDDMSVVYALETRDGVRGVLVDAFGQYADANVAALLDRMRIDPVPGRRRLTAMVVRSLGALLALGVIGAGLVWALASRRTPHDRVDERRRAA